MNIGWIESAIFPRYRRCRYDQRSAQDRESTRQPDYAFVVYNGLRNIQTWLAPRQCPACLDRTPEGQVFCRACDSRLPYLGPACSQCAAPLAVAAAQCGRCLRNPPAYSATTALFRYAFPIDRMILALKFNGRLQHSRVLGEMFSIQLAAGTSRPEILLPVPLHPSRLRERGYNQSLELARIIGRRLKIPVDYRSLRRLRPTRAQADLPLDERARNVQNAFAMTKPLNAGHVALVDDVMTSGHTVNAIAKCLREAGAECIDVWVVARA